MSGISLFLFKWAFLIQILPHLYSCKNVYIVVKIFMQFLFFLV